MDVLEKYLPIGSVVLLKGGNKRIMIIGVCTAEKLNIDDTIPDESWDYSGCLYPEGLLSSKRICVFNHDQIEKIFHLGLIDNEEIMFKKNLNKALEIMHKNKEEKNSKESVDTGSENINKEEEEIDFKENLNSGFENINAKDEKDFRKNINIILGNIDAEENN